MSDPYEGRDYKYDDDKSGRRRKRLDRQTRYDDDAWGMAHNADLGDGARADIEDWASGMVDEEGRRHRNERRSRRDDDLMDDSDDLGGFDRPALGGRSQGSSARGSRPSSARSSGRRYDDSSALSRADQLRQRFDRGGRNSRSADPQAGIYEGDPRKKKIDDGGGSGDFFDNLFAFKVDSLPETISSVAVIAVIAVILISFACVGAAWLTAEELVRTLNLK